jgi:hypothetical protein
MSTLTILDRLLDQSSTTESKEHVIEQAHYAVDNVQERLVKTFDKLVEEISADLGAPEFNASTDPTEGQKHPLPAWVMGGNKAADSTSKVLRLSYWKRETGVSYLLIRQELDSKDRPKYYDVVLGGRRRNRTDTSKIGRLRQTDASFLGWIKRLFSGARA